jgi:hypothetical protein
MKRPAIVLAAVLLATPAPAQDGKPDHGKVPGVVIDYSPAKSRQYIGSPSIAVLPGGEYVASHDFFGPGSTRDRTAVFASADRGKTWTKRSDIVGQWWSTLFVHKDALYLMGTSKEYGHCVIRRSADGGKKWTEPKDDKSGLLHEGKYHCAPVPITIHKGRIWRAMEDAMGPGGWGEHFRCFMMSAPVDSDLLSAASWTSSNRIGRDASWLGGKFGGWLEGNAVVTPEGKVIDLLRADHRDPDEKAAVVRISDDGKTATFDPNDGFLDFPGGCKKFTVRFDPASKRYWTLTNYVPEKFRNPSPAKTRNTLALASSADLKTWEINRVLLQNPDTVKHGFQYADWLFDGDDLIAVVRTAHDDGVGGARNQHDANYMTFHRITAFRKP